MNQASLSVAASMDGEARTAKRRLTNVLCLSLAQMATRLPHFASITFHRKSINVDVDQAMMLFFLLNLMSRILSLPHGVPSSVSNKNHKTIAPTLRVTQTQRAQTCRARATSSVLAVETSLETGSPLATWLLLLHHRQLRRLLALVKLDWTAKAATSSASILYAIVSKVSLKSAPTAKMNKNVLPVTPMTVTGMQSVRTPLVAIRVRAMMDFRMRIRSPPTTLLEEPVPRRMSALS